MRARIHRQVLRWFCCDAFRRVALDHLASREATFLSIVMTRRRTLFLDVDGVLHPSSCPESRMFENLERLEHLLRRHAQIDLVLSSSWRFDQDLMHRLTTTSPLVASRMVATTGSVVPGRWARHQEIKAYASLAELGDAWRALDDSIFEFPRGCPELIACDPERGLDEAVIEAIEAWLRDGAACHAQPSSQWPAPSDTLMAQAAALLQGERMVSISYLQRHLRLGYRAALGLRAALVQKGIVDSEPNAESR